MKANCWSFFFIGSLILTVGIISYFVLWLGPTGSMIHKVLFYGLIAIAFFTAILAVFMGFSFTSSFISSLKLQRRKKENREVILKLAGDLKKELFWVPDLKDGIGTITEWFQTIQTYSSRFEMTGLSPEAETSGSVKSFRIFLGEALGKYPSGWNKAEGDLSPRMDEIIISGKKLLFLTILSKEPEGSEGYKLAMKVNKTIIEFMESNYETLEGLIYYYEKK